MRGLGFHHELPDLNLCCILTNKQCCIGSAILSETVPPCIADKWTIPTAGGHACSCLLVYCSCWACALCNNTLVYCYCRKTSQSDAEGGTGALDLHRLAANWNIFVDEGAAERMRQGYLHCQAESEIDGTVNGKPMLRYQISYQPIWCWK